MTINVGKDKVRKPSLLKLAFWHLAVEREMHPLAFCSFGSETS